MPKDPAEMSESEIRSRIVTLAFGGDERLFIAYRKFQQGLPEGTGIVVRGSAVTNKRHEDGRAVRFSGEGNQRHRRDISWQEGDEAGMKVRSTFQVCTRNRCVIKILTLRRV